ncbi:hypothetical protein LPJ59_006447, partial [Coemansia sp. RSA 2399]
MRVSVGSIVSAVLATGSLVVSAAPAFYTLGDALYITASDAVGVLYMAGTVEANSVDWDSLFSDQYLASASPPPAVDTT